MPRRAKYVGPHEAVDVFLPNGRVVTVENGHLLPTEDDAGEAIPAAFRDSLLEQDQIWSSVDQATPSKKD